MVNYWHLFNKLFDDNIPYSVARLLTFWYSHQKVAVLWHKTLSELFSINNGTRQGYTVGILSPYLCT